MPIAFYFARQTTGPVADLGAAFWFCLYFCGYWIVVRTITLEFRLTWLRWKAHRGSRHNGRRDVLGAHSCELLSEGLRVSNSEGESFHRWSEFTEVENTYDRLFVYLPDGNALVIPKESLTGIRFLGLLYELKSRIGPAVPWLAVTEASASPATAMGA